MSLSNIDIEEICTKYNIKLNKVCAKDQLFRLPLDGGYIVNTNNQDQAGQHWIAFYVKDKHACYFDSFGAPPLVEVCQFLKKGRVKAIYNTSQIQNISDDHCGFYSIYFLYYFQHHKTKNLVAVLRQFTDQFVEFDTKQNVAILKSKYKDII
jgi:hypothetical protein